MILSINAESLFQPPCSSGSLDSTLGRHLRRRIEHEWKGEEAFSVHRLF
jgi:hypothetical protein